MIYIFEKPLVNNSMNTVNTRDVIQNVKNIYINDSILEVLIDFERVLDELDLYAYRHWLEGELVSGPAVERYWITCTFMWPYNRMPDPRGAARLLMYGCKVTYKKSYLRMPLEIQNPSDFQPGTRRGKIERVPIWLVKICMPQEIISSMERGSVEIADETFDLEDLQMSYQRGLDNDMTAKQQAGDL